jgi:hypothetical protein
MGGWVLGVAVLAAPAAAQEPTLADVLGRAGRYVIEFQRQLSGIVAEERYEQNVSPASAAMSRTSMPPVLSRVLKSDLLLVKPVGGDRWVQFRDVFDVDGTPVRDRSERLMKLFMDPSQSLAAQVDRIVQESTRYNIGKLQRTINVPVLALVVLDPVNRSRFRFKRLDSNAAPPVARSAASSAAAAWTIEFREVEKETIIRGDFGRDIPTRGRFWIDPDDGRVLASELIAEDVQIRGEVDVGYDREPGIGLLVPVEMREKYDLRRDGSRVFGTATYGTFRQFQVKVDEKIAPVK